MSSTQFTIDKDDLAYLQDIKTGVVVVIGLAASGKTTVADYLHEFHLERHSFYRTDDYIDHGYEQSLYAMIKDLEADSNPYKLIEGVQGYRFLRKMAETRQFKVDAIVIVKASPATRAARYLGRGKGALPESFDRNLETVFGSYLKLLGETGQALPRIIHIVS